MNSVALFCSRAQIQRTLPRSSGPRSGRTDDSKRWRRWAAHQHRHRECGRQQMGTTAGGRGLARRLPSQSDGTERGTQDTRDAHNRISRRQRLSSVATSQSKPQRTEVLTASVRVSRWEPPLVDHLPSHQQRRGGSGVGELVLQVRGYEQGSQRPVEDRIPGRVSTRIVEQALVEPVALTEAFPRVEVWEKAGSSTAGGSRS